jgi:hypothetical protein
MKTILKTPVIFNPINKTIDFSAVTNFDLRNIYRILNLSTQQDLYVVGAEGYGVSEVTNSIITLEPDLEGMSSNDILFILYEDVFSGGATETTLAAVLAKLIAAPATEAKQDSIIAKMETGLAKETGGNLASIAGKDFATQTTLAAVLAKLIAAPATEAKQDTLINKIIQMALGQNPASSSLSVALADEDVKDLLITGASAQTATVNNILANPSGINALDVSQYRSFAVQIISTGTGGTYIFEGSNDGVNFVVIPVYNQSLAVRVPIITAITATASSVIYEGSCNFRYIRLRIATTITGGNIQAFGAFVQQPLGTVSQIVSNGTAANLLVTATISGTPAVSLASTVLTTSTTLGYAAFHKAVSAASTNATSVKNAAGTIGMLCCHNDNAGVDRYLKLYNKNSAPVVGTDIPVLTFVLPANDTFCVDIPTQGMRFTAGIAYAITSGYADNDTGNVVANEVFINILYV